MQQFQDHGRSSENGIQAQDISRDAKCRDFTALKSANVGSLNGKCQSLMHKRVAE
jgi:hypothetical protein